MVSQMALVQDDHVIQALATDAPKEPLDIRILPRIRGAMTSSSIPICRTRCRNEAL
jgi:hypothetical protein